MVVIGITGSLDMFSQYKNDIIIVVAKPRHSQMVQNVLNYNMQMRFLQFLKVHGARPYARQPCPQSRNVPPGYGESPPKSREVSVFDQSMTYEIMQQVVTDILTSAFRCVLAPL